jgi:hypothetical protein
MELMNNRVVTQYLLFLTISLSSFVFAGTPEQDFPVDLLRERFRDSKSLTVDFLRQSFQWRCVELNATHNVVPNYNKQDIYFSFSVVSPSVIIDKSKSTGFSAFSLTSQGLEAREGSKHFLLRRTDSDQLIGEVALSKYDTKLKRVFKSLTRPEMMVSAFWYCSKVLGTYKINSRRHN